MLNEAVYFYDSDLLNLQFYNGDYLKTFFNNTAYRAIPRNDQNDNRADCDLFAALVIQLTSYENIRTTGMISPHFQIHYI